MRQVDREMVSAVIDVRPWSNGNTRVDPDPNGTNECHIYLHGNLIATAWGGVGWVGNLEVEVDTLKRWPTNTTINRLRALGADIRVDRKKVFLNNEFVVER